MAVDQVDPLISSIYHWMDVSGVLLMGIIGGTLARQLGYDIVGFFFIAMLSALGGGMLRDVLINQGTVAAMSQPEYLILAFTGALVARFTYFKGKAWELCSPTATRWCPPCGRPPARPRPSSTACRFCPRS